MGKFLDSATNSDLSRRKFLALSAGSAALAGLAASGCSPKQKSSTVSEHAEPVDEEEGNGCLLA